MRGHYIKVGDKQQGPYLTKAAAVAEAKALRERGFKVTVVSKEESDSKFFGELPTPEEEIDIDADDDDGNDDDDNDDDNDDNDDDDKGKKKQKKAKDKKDDNDDDSDDDDDDSTPSGVHGFFKRFGES